MQQSSCKKFIPAFARVLDNVDVAAVSSYSYCQTYLSHLLQHRFYYLDIYAGVLDQLNNTSKKSPAVTTVTDIGAGNGLLSIFAKYCGYEKVFCNDISTEFLTAAEKLSQLLHIKIDGFILGDITVVKDFFTGNKTDAVIGTDVIEHIYNLEDFVQKISAVNPAMITVFTTASNPQNYCKVKKLQLLQRRDEQEGFLGNSVDTVKHEAFFQMRKKIITSRFKQLDAATILRLSAATRGMIEEDIVRTTNNFLQSNKLPQPAEGYNTCDPITGSWSERIVSLQLFDKIYSENGFSLKVYRGFYDDKTPGLKKYMNKIRNIFILFTGLKISPFIGLIGFKK